MAPTQGVSRAPRAQGYRGSGRREVGGREHTRVAQRALGRPMPAGACVHHVNGDPSDNRPGNLVICEDRAYHNLLHQRLRALRACGQADWRRCTFCGEYADPSELKIGKAMAYHRDCKNAYRRERNVAHRKVAA